MDQHTLVSLVNGSTTVERDPSEVAALIASLTGRWVSLPHRHGTSLICKDHIVALYPLPVE